ncbi:MAG: AAA family ATPase [Bryobacteraceae bacterium]|nr:AAA family ATPase [Bryobacteraceae bacterium]
MPQLESVDLRGYKSILLLEDFRPGAITVLIGANGAGKSNLISFFRLLSWTLSGQLQEFVARAGGASAILHDGPQTTRDVSASIYIRTESGRNSYHLRLSYSAGDALVFTEERYRFQRTDDEQAFTDLGVGHRESQLADRPDRTARTIRSLLKRIVVHQFHDTSSTARIRQRWDIGESLWLKEDAGNLAPFLYRLQRDSPTHYIRVRDTIRQVLPFFADFELLPEYDKLLLRWREVGTDVVFHAGQAADGMLRAMALITLLLQPEESLPDVLIFDEPELGLHPYAIEVLASLIRAVSRRVQVIIATQSVGLIDYFDAGDVVVVERHGRTSVVRRLDPERLSQWLSEYSLSELWEKNVLGGRPSR